MAAIVVVLSSCGANYRVGQKGKPQYSNYVDCKFPGEWDDERILKMASI